MFTVDTKGLSCPQPMLMVKNKMEEMKSGGLKVIADADASRENISRAASHLGWEKVSEDFDDGVYTMEFRK